MADNLTYQEDWPEELIDGKVIAMSPAATNHNRIVGNIYRIFSNYLYGKVCVPFADNEFVFLTDKDEFVPDFMIVCDRNKIKYDGVHGAPDLVVEVLSPSTARNDRTRKKEVYAKCGVREYWLVSPSDKFLEVYHNHNGEFVLYDIYTVYSDWMIAKMDESKRTSIVTHFKCSLYGDLDISLNEIFSDLFLIKMPPDVGSPDGGYYNFEELYATSLPSTCMMIKLLFFTTFAAVSRFCIST